MDFDLSKVKSVYFIGIGGIGISAIARMLLAQGATVSGSDIGESEITNELKKLGVKIDLGQDLKLVSKDVELIVYTKALEVSAPDFLKSVKGLGVLVLSYPETLFLVSKEKFTIAIAGTHGKTTTTAMIGKVMIDAKKDPTLVVGSMIQGSTLNGKKGRTFVTNFVSGKGDYFVVEADEYRRAFLNLYPKILIITNIDADHLDYYKDLADVQSAFAELVGRLPKDGILICNPNLPNLKPVLDCAVCTVLDYSSVDVSVLKLKVPGKHNRENAQVALVLAGVLEINQSVAVKSLNEFSGTWRRFEYKGKTKTGALVYDDYAHNPHKVRSALQGARELYPDKKIFAVFQPHLFSRTKTLLTEFGKSFKDADEIILLPIYPAREAFDPTINSEMLEEKIKSGGQLVKTVKNFDMVAEYLKTEAKMGDIIMIMGAGDINNLTKFII